MRTRKLRLVSALLALTMLLTMVPVGAFADTAMTTGTGPKDDLIIKADGLPYNYVDDNKNTYDANGTLTASSCSDDSSWSYSGGRSPTLNLHNGTYNFGTATVNYEVDGYHGATIEGGTFAKAVYGEPNTGYLIINGGIYKGYLGSTIHINGGYFQGTIGGSSSISANSSGIFVGTVNASSILGGIFSTDTYNAMSKPTAHTITVKNGLNIKSINDYDVTADNWLKSDADNVLYVVGASSAKIVVDQYATEDKSNTKGTEFTIQFADGDNNVTISPVPKNAPQPSDFEFDSTTNEVKTKSNISGMGEVTNKYYKKNADDTLSEIGSKPTEPGEYVVKISVAEGDAYTATTSDLENNSEWMFSIKDTTTPDDTTARKYPISGSDSAEVTVTDQNGDKRDTNEAEKGDTVRVTLPEDKRNPGGMVFDGWILDVEPEEKTADVLDALKQNGFKPGEPDTSFTVPDLPDGTKLNFRPHYVTPDQSGSSDDSFLMTAAAVAGGAALTGFVAWQGYNIFAEVYMKQALPAGAALPQNRQQLAAALWNNAGNPAPTDSTLYTDVAADDANAQAAARWAVENELMKPADKNDENAFKPEKSVSVGQVYRAWKKAEMLG